MKHFYFLLALLWLASTGRSAAQTQPTDSARQYLSTMFAPLDKSQLPTPYLEDYGYRFMPLRIFNGTLSDSARTSLHVWRQLFATVVSGTLKGSDDLPALSNINARLTQQQNASSAIPIIIERLDYATLRPNAIQAGLLRAQNNQLFDVAGRSQSPYVLRTLFAAAPSLSSSPTANVSFVFTQQLHIQSGGGNVQSLYLDFGDGQGYRAAAWNSPLAIQYGSAGTYRVKVKVSYANTATYESHFDLQVLADPVSQSLAQNGPTPLGNGFTNGWVYPSGAVTIPFNPTLTHSGGKVTIVYGGQSRQQITKPLIVVEGYDPSTIAPDVQSNYSVSTFLNNINRTYNGLNVRDEFGADYYSSATSAAYDLIFIDYNNGTDDIRRNAALFEEVVRYVNQQKQGGVASGQQNVVLGISMGGLVARYGLAEMEKAQAGSTHTRLLVTHDSPHRGANTPLGIQALTRQGASTWLGQAIQLTNSSGIPHLLSGSDIFPQLIQGDRLLDEPATKQLLLVRATVQRVFPYVNAAANTYGSEFNSFLANEYRSMITPANGQSFPYRFVATSLGSQCGKTTLSPYDELVRIEGGGYASIGVASAGLNTEIITNALPPAGQVQRISSLRIWLQIRVLIFTKRFYLSNVAFQSPSNNPVAWDGLPGGVQYIKSNVPLKTGSSSGGFPVFAPIVGYAKNVQLANTFCFIPSASALDVPLTSANAQANYVNGVASSNPAPQPLAFIAEGSDPNPDQGVGGFVNNYPHPFFTGRFAKWIYDEMERPFNGNNNAAACDPNPECNPAAGKAISGPSGLCVGGNGPATYTSPLQGTGYTYTWTASPASAFTVSSGSGPTFQTANVPGVNSTGTITLTVNTGCQVVFSKSVKVGAPARPAFYQRDASDMCYSGTAYYNITNYDPSLSYSIWAVGATGIMDPGGFRLKKRGSGYVSFTLSVSNGCGTSTAEGEVEFNCDGYSRAYAVYPNPAADDLTIEQTSSPDSKSSAARSTSAKTTATSTPFTVRLYDTYGTLHVQQTTSAAALRLGVSTLPAGLYLLRIEADGKVVESRQLQITH